MTPDPQAESADDLAATLDGLVDRMADNHRRIVGLLDDAISRLGARDGQAVGADPHLREAEAGERQETREPQEPGVPEKAGRPDEVAASSPVAPAAAVPPPERPATAELPTTMSPGSMEPAPASVAGGRRPWQANLIVAAVALLVLILAVVVVNVV